MKRFLLLTILLIVSPVWSQSTQPTTRPSLGDVQRTYSLGDWPGDTAHDSWVFPQLCPVFLLPDTATERVKLFNQVRTVIDNSTRGWDFRYYNTEEISVLLTAMVVVESHGDPTRVGKSGDTGWYQLRRCYVDDVIRIYDRHINGTSQWNFREIAEDLDASTCMVLYYTMYWSNPLELPAGQRCRPIKAFEALAVYSPQDAETIARIHNGGPKGASKASTLKYWQKVAAEMRTLRGELFPYVSTFVLPGSQEKE